MQSRSTLRLQQRVGGEAGNLCWNRARTPLPQVCVMDSQVYRECFVIFSMCCIGGLSRKVGLLPRRVGEIFDWFWISSRMKWPVRLDSGLATFEQRKLQVRLMLAQRLVFVVHFQQARAPLPSTRF